MRIAITGGIADGKSTVCSMLAEMGFEVVSADEIVAELHHSPEILERIGSEIGEEFVTGGALNRDRMRDVIGKDAGVRSKLNAILHPPAMDAIMSRTHIDGVAFAEVPLLIETATQGWFDEVWVVAAGESIQRQRLVERLGSTEAADRMLKSQLPTSAKIPFADRVVRTNEPVETVKLTIAEYVRRLVEE
jgi:dephospho-CoA kinase